MITDQTLQQAVTAHQEGKLEEAEKLYKKILDTEPTNLDANKNLSILLLKLGKLDEAETSCKKTIELKPDFMECYYDLGNILYQLGKLDEAEKNFQKVIELKPDHIEAYFNLGVIFVELGDNLKAKSFYEKVIKINPNHEKALINLAEIFLGLGEFEKYWDYFVKHLQLKSKKTVSKANLQNVIPKLVKKLQKQNSIPTFFDNAVLSQLRGETSHEFDFCDIFEKELFSKEKRFVLYSSRIKSQLEVKSENKLYRGFPYLLSQGAHSTIKWKEVDLCKTTFDLAIFSMILQEVKPDTIIELGSGLGGSATWLADIASALGLKTHIYSYDIKKPSINHKNITFIEYDLNKMNGQNLPPCSELFKGKKILIEDAHVNLENTLNLFDTILKKDDYLIIEDSDIKHDVISKFLIEKESKYRLDQFFLDFFGRNVTSCSNSIFKIY